MKKRCLVIVDGFYEWRENEGKKYPYYIYLHNRDAFALAGIWETWVNKETGEGRNTFSIITTRANNLMEKIHNTKKRMPVILKKEVEKNWLREDLSTDEIRIFLEPYDDIEMKAHAVSRLISTKGANTNTPNVMKRYEYQELKTV